MNTRIGLSKENMILDEHAHESLGYDSVQVCPISHDTDSQIDTISCGRIAALVQ